jgi:undecaprenyl-diphosphatase
MPVPSDALFARLDRHERTLCLTCNRIARWRYPRRLLAAASRLGDGVFWYLLMLLLPLLDGRRGAAVALQMALTGAVGLLIYRRLKGGAARERPYARHAGIDLVTAPLDRFSFPSGHTLHAVGFTLVACAGYPGLAWLLVPLTLLIAVSRVVLGLHYPSDVLAGAAVGAGLAWLFTRAAALFGGG